MCTLSVVKKKTITPRGIRTSCGSAQPCTGACVYLSLSLYIYIYMYVCMYVCIYIYIYIYIYKVALSLGLASAMM